MGHIKKTLSDYAKENTLRLHMPGHKGTVDEFDVTEIPQTDDLNSPEGPYKRAVDFLTETYKSTKSYFITSGATLGIQTAVLYAKMMGYKIIASRNSHKSIINACLIFEAECDILNPVFDNKTQTFRSIANEIISYLNNTNEKCAIFITNPDYYGRCENIKEISSAARKNGALLICDEAHGSHFAFSENLPQSSAQYADIWINGAHKTLGALTQGAFLNCGKNVVINVMDGIFHALNTSSPSYIIAASLEEAVLDSKNGGWDIKIKQCEEFVSRTNELRFLKCVADEWAENAGYIKKDVTRIVIDAKNAGGGYYLYDKLYKDFNIQLEMADFRYAVAIITIYDTEDCLERLYAALKALDNEKEAYKILDLPLHGRKVCEINEAWLKNSRAVAINKAEGKISAGILGPYPPGTALVLPGEMITREHIDFFNSIIKSGGHVFGEINGEILIADI